MACKILAGLVVINDITNHHHLLSEYCKCNTCSNPKKFKSWIFAFFVCRECKKWETLFNQPEKKRKYSKVLIVTCLLFFKTMSFITVISSLIYILQFIVYPFQAFQCAKLFSLVWIQPLRGAPLNICSALLVRQPGILNLARLAQIEKICT